MPQVTARDAKLRFGELLKRVRAGEEIEITQDKEVVARLVGEPVRDMEAVREAVAGLRALQKKIGGKPSKNALREWRSAVNEGRR